MSDWVTDGFNKYDLRHNHEKCINIHDVDVQDDDYDGPFGIQANILMSHYSKDTK